MPGRITTRIMPGVAKDVGCFAIETVAELRRLIECRHKLTVQVVPGQVVCVRDGTRSVSGFGVFTTTYKHPRIFIAGTPLPRREMSREEWLYGTRVVICHEFAHYEQFRDGRKLNERGIEQRAKKLAALVEESLAA